ncbi:MAG: hypothetical protein ACD_4C00101G0003 [uncultured bacterium (gcode 4)]|uniref:Uncharacterized protein n=1 Tax=uncultured bacterium (gcode 4) TaxID=1234023 RepID=K2F745_9BACT|nr:MAG: hypothetical protein ACD_4C00101G0003 [uncultured bacterium (gcode 4)]
MKNSIEPVKWTKEFFDMYEWKEELVARELDYMNSYIKLYNLLEDWTEEKKILWEFLVLLFINPVWEYLWVDLWIPLKEDFSDKDELRNAELHWKIEEIRERYKNAIN